MIPTAKTLLTVNNLVKWFPLQKGLLSRMAGKTAHVRAVDGVDFVIDEGEVFGLVGESGCGKTTTGRLLLRLIEPTSGAVYFDGANIFDLDGNALRLARRKMQPIFQDPYESLNPRKNVTDIVAEPLLVNGIGSPQERRVEVARALEAVELHPIEEMMRRYPHELSGGQRQRVAIARSLVLEPRFIVADEPVSMLDVSIRTEILNLLLDLKEKFSLTYLFITHDLAVAKYLCDRIAVMYVGKIVEVGPAETIIGNPRHPYTQALVAAVPEPDPYAEIKQLPIKGEVTSPTNIPSGCRFRLRCPYAFERCVTEEPPLLEVGEGVLAACHLYPGKRS